MSWLKPPPLVPKPACPAVQAGWAGLPTRFVRQIVIVSVSFWLAALFLPAFILLVMAWPALKGTWLGAACVFGVVFIGYVCLMLGTWAARVMVVRGHLQRALAKKTARKK